MEVLSDFIWWLARYGETSWDHQSFFAGPIGGRAKALYYRNKLIGTAAVAPMIFLEAFLPAGRRLFHRPLRFPIADAHYAMGFAFLYEATEDSSYRDRAIHFLRKLKGSRCGGFERWPRAHRRRQQRWRARAEHYGDLRSAGGQYFRRPSDVYAPRQAYSHNFA